MVSSVLLAVPVAWKIDDATFLTLTLEMFVEMMPWLVEAAGLSSLYSWVASHQHLTYPNFRKEIAAEPAPAQARLEGAPLLEQLLHSRIGQSLCSQNAISMLSKKLNATVPGLRLQVRSRWVVAVLAALAMVGAALLAGPPMVAAPAASVASVAAEDPFAAVAVDLALWTWASSSCHHPSYHASASYPYPC